MEKTAVVFIHGFMGNRAIFDRVVELLGDARCELFKLTLPGHETDINNFAGSDKEQWQDAVNDCVSRLSREYERLVLVGHSMGGLLAINAAIAAPDKDIKIIAAALPLALKFSFSGAITRLKTLAAPRPGDSDELRAARNFCGVYGIRASALYKLVPNNIELLRVIAQTKKSLPLLASRRTFSSGNNSAESRLLKSGITVINSERDELVSKKALRIVARALPTAKIIRLKSASHFLYPENEQQLIADEIKKAIG